jgi:hypothetical protein
MGDVAVSNSGRTISVIRGDVEAEKMYVPIAPNTSETKITRCEIEWNTVGDIAADEKVEDCLNHYLA